MKKGLFKNPVIDHIDEPAPQEKDSPVKPIGQQPSNTKSQNLESSSVDNVPDKRIIKQPKKQNMVSVSDPMQIKLISTVRELFLHMRRRTIDESPDCALILKKAVPFEEPEEQILGSDPLIMLQHIKKIFDKVLELKGEAEREAAMKNENECGDYESMLQKLEAEVRQHIRIEQQLKLYVESVQSKLEEHEKEGDISKLVNIQGEVDNLKQENSGLNDKVKICKDEITNLKRRIHKKVEMIEKLEKQLENIPVLKKIVKEMDRVLDGEPPAFSVQESLPIGSQRSAKEAEDQGSLHTFGQNDIKARKRSQPVVGSHNVDKNKDSNKYIRVVDGSMQSNVEPKVRESLGKDRLPKGSRDEVPSRKSTARGEEKIEEFEDVLKKSRKSISKGESNRQTSKDRERHNPDQEGGVESNVKDAKFLVNSKAKEDIIESSKFGCEAAFKAGMQKYLKKSFDKPEHKVKGNVSSAKKNKTHVLDNSKDKIDMKAPSRKNSASKGSRPGTGERVRHHDHTQHSPDHHNPDPYRSKEAPKRQGHDRSQSVENRKKLVRQHKSKASINEDEVEESYKKHQVSFNGHYKGAASYARVNQSGSGIFMKGHN